MDCVTLGSDIAKVSLVLNGYVREVREARADVDGISRELHSLQSVLDLMKEDAELFPPRLAAQTPAILERTSKLVQDLDNCFAELNRSDLSKPDKRKLWAARGRKDSAKFRPALEAHRAIIGLSLDLVEATTLRDIDTEKADDMGERENDTSILEDVSRILVELGSLQTRLVNQFDTNGFERALHEYMMVLRTHAEGVITGREEDYANQGVYMGQNELFGAYIGDSPDSAIGLYEVPVLKTLKEAIARNAEYGVHQIEDILEEEELTDIPSRAPTPPPKDLKRLEIARRETVSSPEPSPTDTEATPTETMPAEATSAEATPTETSPVEPPAMSPTESQFRVVTKISTGSLKSISPSTTKNSRFSKMIGHMRKASFSERPTTGAVSNKASSTESRPSEDVRPSTPILQGSLVRRGSRRLSVNFKKLPMWSTDLDELLGPEKDTVFGVPLQKSLQVAKGTVKTHHSGGGRASRREYPLCIQKCCLYIKEEGVEAPGIFAEPGDARRVQELRAQFGAPPMYGEDVDWTRYTTHDAASLILLFLAQLPKPLIAEATAKRWAGLARQAAADTTAPGARRFFSSGTRSDECLDFWEEALGPVRGPARAVLKLLLNLWADIAAASPQNDMPAERLAACVLKPLMHVSSEKHEADFVFALAFLIRKRVEYVDLLRTDPKQQQQQQQTTKPTKQAKQMKRISRIAW